MLENDQWNIAMYADWRTMFLSELKLSF